jgi:hypothetical protein
MTWDHAGMLRGEIALGQMQIGATDAASMHVDGDLAWSGLRFRSHTEPEWTGVDRAGLLDPPRAHHISLVAISQLHRSARR